MADLVKKARHATNTGRTLVMTFRGVYDDKQGQGVFDAEGNVCLGMGGRKQEEHTVHQREHKIDHRTVFQQLGGADPIQLEQRIGEYHCFRNLGLSQSFASKGREGDRTGLQRDMYRNSYPKTSLCKTHKAQTKDDPAVLPRHSVHPGCG